MLCMLVYMCIFTVTGTHLTSWWRETIYVVPFWMFFWILFFTGGGVVVVSAGRSCLVALADCCYVLYYESSMHNAHTRSYSDSWCVYDFLWIDRCKYKYICTYIYIYICINIYIYVCIALYHHPWTPAFQDSPYTRWSSSTVAIFSMNLEIALNFKGKEESLPSFIVFEGGDSC